MPRQRRVVLYREFHLQPSDDKIHSHVQYPLTGTYTCTCTEHSRTDMWLQLAILQVNHLWLREELSDMWKEPWTVEYSGCPPSPSVDLSLRSLPHIPQDHWMSDGRAVRLGARCHFLEFDLLTDEVGALSVTTDDGNPKQANELHNGSSWSCRWNFNLFRVCINDDEAHLAMPWPGIVVGHFHSWMGA